MAPVCTLINKVKGKKCYFFTLACAQECKQSPDRTCAMGWSWELRSWAWIVSTTRLNLRLGPGDEKMHTRKTWAMMPIGPKPQRYYIQTTFCCVSRRYFIYIYRTIFFLFGKIGQTFQKCQWSMFIQTRALKQSMKIMI